MVLTIRVQQIGMIIISLIKILTTIDSNNFNHKNKIGKFKFNDINDLLNNIKNNAISKANAQKKINKLNKKKVETKVKHLINSQKTLLSLFDDLKTTITTTIIIIIAIIMRAIVKMKV